MWCGLFCSPHLHFLEERYQINGQLITQSGLARLVAEIRPFVDAIDAANPDELKLTFFEITTAAALLLFSAVSMLALYLIQRVQQWLPLNPQRFGAVGPDLAFNTAAFQAEIYRAGLQAIPRGEIEAARLLGLSRWQILFRIEAPQAFPIGAQSPLPRR